MIYGTPQNLRKDRCVVQEKEEELVLLMWQRLRVFMFKFVAVWWLSVWTTLVAIMPSFAVEIDLQRYREIKIKRLPVVAKLPVGLQVTSPVVKTPDNKLIVSSDGQGIFMFAPLNSIKHGALQQLSNWSFSERQKDDYVRSPVGIYRNGNNGYSVAFASVTGYISSIQLPDGKISTHYFPDEMFENGPVILDNKAVFITRGAKLHAVNFDGTLASVPIVGPQTANHDPKREVCAEAGIIPTGNHKFIVPITILDGNTVGVEINAVDLDTGWIEKKFFNDYVPQTLFHCGSDIYFADRSNNLIRLAKDLTRKADIKLTGCFQRHACTTENYVVLGCSDHSINIVDTKRGVVSASHKFDGPVGCSPVFLGIDGDGQKELFAVSVIKEGSDHICIFDSEAKVKAVFDVSEGEDRVLMITPLGNGQFATSGLTKEMSFYRFGNPI